MVKKKHIKQIKKNRLRKETQKKVNEPEIDFDTSAYVIYNRLEMTYPCLSFDVVKDHLEGGPDRVSKFPLSLYMVAGAQTPPHVDNNYIYVMKVDNIKPLKQEDETVEDEESDGGEGEDDSDNLPKLTSVRIAHKGCVNRLRTNKMGGRTLTASWSALGKVHIFDITTPLHAVADQKSINTYTAQKVDPKPIFTYGGHPTEGYAIDWAPHRIGSLATGDCKKNVLIWAMRNQSEWNVDPQSLVGHEDSVEDIQWSPEDADVLATCSVDKSVILWDLRLPNATRCVTKIVNSHNSDVNVIDWNQRCKNLIVSGGDDGVVKVWDVRLLKKADTTPHPVAQFDYHKKPITSVEWDPNDDTVLAVASDDNKLTLWDLAVEKDEEQEEADADTMEVDEQKEQTGSESSESDEESEDEEDENENEEENEDGVEYADLKQIPEQMLFLHQGQVEIKELHWHPQYNGLLISTALNGINIFKTISA